MIPKAVSSRAISMMPDALNYHANIEIVHIALWLDSLRVVYGSLNLEQTVVEGSGASVVGD